MKKNKITISIFAAVCIIGTIVGYSLLKQRDSNKYGQLAIMVKQDDGSYIRSNMSTFGNEDYEFDHAVCNNGSTATANLSGGVNLKLLGTDKCTVYLNLKTKTITEKIKAEAKTTKPDFTKTIPKYIPGENFTINHIYEGYTNVNNEATEFTYNTETKQWEAPTGFDEWSKITFSINEDKENIAICYDSGYSGKSSSYSRFYKNSTPYYTETEGGQLCIKIGTLKTTDTLSFESLNYEDGWNGEGTGEFKFYLVDDYIINDTESGVYKITDDYGTSYYFRGDVKNNYVKFGDFFWRIVRLNGDGTLRIAYDGTTPHANGEVSTDRALPTSQFNTSKDSNAHVGYMYGNINGTTYDEVHRSTKSSTSSEIKKYLDSWYETNIRDKGLAGYVSDTLFCNDRSISPNPDGSIGTGVGTTTETKYGAYERLYTNNNPSLVCLQGNDMFTVESKTVNSKTTNGALTYPIGLLTADEYVLAGSKYSISTLNSYLNKPGIDWWLGTPYNCYYSAYELYVDNDGSLYNYYVNNVAAIVPVINLSAEAANQLKGSGTMEDPYHF